MKTEISEETYLILHLGYPSDLQLKWEQILRRKPACRLEE